jgi:hypothetical protein
LTQTMMTLANLTGGRAKVMIGAGEAKQVTPHGWKRSEGSTVDRILSNSDRMRVLVSGLVG